MLMNFIIYYSQSSLRYIMVGTAQMNIMHGYVMF
jgi:hypothetical protein